MLRKSDPLILQPRKTTLLTTYIVCLDKIDIKSMSVNDLIVIYEDKIVKKHKVKILELKNIIFTRENMLQYAALD